MTMADRVADSAITHGIWRLLCDWRYRLVRPLDARLLHPTLKLSSCKSLRHRGWLSYCGAQLARRQHPELSRIIQMEIRLNLGTLVCYVGSREGGEAREARSRRGKAAGPVCIDQAGTSARLYIQQPNNMPAKMSMKARIQNIGFRSDPSDQRERSAQHRMACSWRRQSRLQGILLCLLYLQMCRF